MAAWSAITRITTFDFGCHPGGGAVRFSTPAGQDVVAVGDRAGGIGAALTGAARILGAQPVDHRGHPLFPAPRRPGPAGCPNTDTVSVSSSQAPMMKSRPRTAVSVRRCASGSYRVDLRIHRHAQLVFGQPFPVHGPLGDRGVDLGPRLLALHQPGGPGDRRDQPGAQRALADTTPRPGAGARAAPRRSASAPTRAATRSPSPHPPQQRCRPTDRTPTTPARRRHRCGGGSTPRSQPTGAHQRSPPGAPRPRSPPPTPHH